MKSSRILLISMFVMAARPAFAAEDEVVVAFEAGYRFLSTPRAGQHGGAGHLTVAYGLTDALWLTGSLGGGRQAARTPQPAVTLLEGFGGVTLALDVLRTIPFVEVLVGAVYADLGEDRTKLDPTVRIGVGADYLLSPSLSLGAVLRWRPVSDDVGDSILDAQLRLCWRIEL